MGLLTLILWLIPAFLGFLVVLLFYLDKKRAGYCKKMGIPYAGGQISQFYKLIRGTLNMTQLEEILYQELVKSKAPILGIADMGGATNLFISDPDILRNILVKDFDHFVNRRDLKTQEGSKYFKKMLFAAQNEQWKGTRVKLSPTFTTGRIRRMFKIFKTSSERMDKYLQHHMGLPQKKAADVDFAQIFSKYAMDVIASSAFGIDSKTWEQPPDKSSTFEKMGRQFGFHFTGKALAKFIVMMLAPKIADMLGLDVMDEESQAYFESIVKDVIRRRRETGERREDFLQLMLDTQQNLLKADEETAQVMNGGTDGSGTSLDSGDTKKLGVFDDEAVTANAMLFLLGGFDTTQSALLFTVYSLALNPEVQEKLHEEVKGVMEKHKGNMSYEAMMEMTYLDMVINESLRLFPPASRLERVCNQDYPVPGTKLVIEKDAVIVVPIMGIHRDPDNYSDPEKFMPERFTTENKAARHPYKFLPFGMGPRNCIGMRFALVEAKAVLIEMIQSYRFAPCAQTKIPVEFGSSVTLKPKHGMWLSVSAR